MSEHSVPAPLEQQLFVDRAITCNRMLLDAMTDAVDPIQRFVALQNATRDPDTLMIDTLLRADQIRKSAQIGIPALQQPLLLFADQEHSVDSVFWKHPIEASIGSMAIVACLLNDTSAYRVSDAATGSGNEHVRTEVFVGSYNYRGVRLTRYTYRNPTDLNSEQIVYMRPASGNRSGRIANKIISWANRPRT